MNVDAKMLNEILESHTQEHIGITLQENIAKTQVSPQWNRLCVE